MKESARAPAYRSQEDFRSQSPVDLGPDLVAEEIVMSFCLQFYPQENLIIVCNFEANMKVATVFKKFGLLKSRP